MTARRKFKGWFSNPRKMQGKKGGWADKINFEIGKNVFLMLTAFSVGPRRLVMAPPRFAPLEKNSHSCYGWK